jgi:hypothetical protein
MNVLKKTVPRDRQAFNLASEARWLSPEYAQVQQEASLLAVTPIWASAWTRRSRNGGAIFNHGCRAATSPISPAPEFNICA